MNNTLSEDYKRLRDAILQLQEAVSLLADVEIEEIRFKGPRQPMAEFHRKLLMETLAIERSHTAAPNEMLRLEGVSLTHTSSSK